MREYVSLPDTILDDQPRLAEIIAAAKQFAASLPPKVKKPRGRKTSRLSTQRKRPGKMLGPV